MKKIHSLLAGLLVFILMVSASGIAYACQAGTTLSAEKTANGFRGQIIEYNWTLEKSVSPQNIEVKRGGTQAVTYNLVATRTKFSQTEGAGVSGQICVENGGERATENLKLVDRVQYKTGPGPFQNLPGASQTIIPPSQLSPHQSSCYSYSIEFNPIVGAQYRNVVKVTITNHSGHLGQEFGPEPKADFRLPESPTVTYIDDKADLTDVENVLAGFNLSHVDTGDGTGPWHLTTSQSISFDKEINNESAICNEQFDLENTATLIESNNHDPVREGTAVVNISSGECETPPTPTPSPSGGGGTTTNIKKPKVSPSPQVLGTQAPVEEEALPVSGADINYDWVYYFLIIGSLLMTYYLKVRGWKKIRA